MKREEVEERSREDENWIIRIEERDKERQREERWKRIRESRYNKWYKEMKEMRIPKYLKKGWGEEE